MRVLHFNGDIGGEAMTEREILREITFIVLQRHLPASSINHLGIDGDPIPRTNDASSTPSAGCDPASRRRIS